MRAIRLRELQSMSNQGKRLDNNWKKNPLWPPQNRPQEMVKRARQFRKNSIHTHTHTHTHARTHTYIHAYICKYIA